MTGQPRACDATAPHTPGPIRPYPCGWRCLRHTPAAAAGRPEAPEPTPKEPAR